MSNALDMSVRLAKLCKTLLKVADILIPLELEVLALAGGGVDWWWWCCNSLPFRMHSHTRREHKLYWRSGKRARRVDTRQDHIIIQASAYTAAHLITFRENPAERISGSLQEAEHLFEALSH